ncbi:MAG: fibrobacter succinogenes major paralogous domain-containing protein [Chlorobiaceae bacterium]
MKKNHLSFSGMLFLLLTAVISLPSRNAEGFVRFTDSEGYEINFVHIVDQFWMRDNLNVKKYRNGDKIRHAKTTEEWLDAAAKGEGAWCHVNNDPANEDANGLIYNWYAVNDPRGLAPEGWHVATLKDLKTLGTSLGGVPVSNKDLSSPEATEWRYQHSGVERSIYFKAVPAGLRVPSNGSFRLFGEKAVLWASTEHSSKEAWSATLDFPGSIITIDAKGEQAGASVRCLKD